MVQDDYGLKKQRLKSKQDFLAIKIWTVSKKKLKVNKLKVHLSKVRMAVVKKVFQAVVKTAIFREKKLLL